MQRERRTCDLAGFGKGAINEPNLVEWNYGNYEGLTTDQIKEKQPNWKLFQDGCPGGESPAQVGARADRVIAMLRALNADAIVFSSGHIMRVLAARWLGLDPSGGRYFALGTTTLSMLGYEHDGAKPVISSGTTLDRIGCLDCSHASFYGRSSNLIQVQEEHHEPNCFAPDPAGPESTGCPFPKDEVRPPAAALAEWQTRERHYQGRHFSLPESRDHETPKLLQPPRNQTSTASTPCSRRKSTSLRSVPFCTPFRPRGSLSSLSSKEMSQLVPCFAREDSLRFVRREGLHRQTRS